MARFSADNICVPIRRKRFAAPKFLPSKTLRLALIAATALGGSIAPAFVPDLKPAQAQEFKQRDPNAQLLLKADQLTYDNDAETVTASGNVQLDYDGYNVVANRVSYNQKTGRVKAFGNVEIVEPDGNRIYAQEIDLTDDFKQGFINALRVETPDNTRFAAESAERFEDGKTVFHHGVYTACEPCKEKPNKAPIWQVKAQKVTIDGVTKTISYEKATFELFGMPIAYLPYFSHADQSVKRKSGFLIPTVGYADKFGFWYRQSYFLVTGDSHDLTFNATGFTKQGALGEVAWRHQLENGTYSVKVAGISQMTPDAFTTVPDKNVKERGMIGTKGAFDINPRWTFGWKVLAQTDNNFSRTYKIKGYSGSNITNEVYLRGLHNRSFFDLSAKQYLIQNNTVTGTGTAFQFTSNQPLIRPVLDYNYVTTEEASGGQINLDVNITSLERNVLSTTLVASGDDRTHGFDGETTRVSADLGWKKTIVTSGGLMITPSLSVRGDWTSANGIASPGNTITTGTYTRFMPTAGLEVSYPILARTANGSHVFEPIAQVFIRPDLNFTGVAPNEDAQSLVFDASTLFQRDKFSGYDRIEGGTRANVGLRYSGQFNNGISLNALVGQSYHLAGQNPYAREDDLTNTGEESGLETRRSDYVASFAISGTTGLSLNTQARFSENNFDVKRAEANVSFSKDKISLSSNYTFIAAQPDYGFNSDRQQVGLSGRYKITDNWSIYGAAQYDIQSDTVISDSVGFSYADECFTFSLAFSERRSTSPGAKTSQAFSFKIGLRTIGDFEGGFSGDDLEELSSGNTF
ncbi:MAG: LPS-assembly protein LptD [Rhizobiaceae bacterium]